MDEVSVIFAKLAGLQKNLKDRIGNHRFFDPINTEEYFVNYAKWRDKLKELLPKLYGDLTIRTESIVTESFTNDSRGYIDQRHLMALLRDIDYIFEVRANSRIGEKTLESMKKEFIFVTHGRSVEWFKIQSYLERDLGLKTIELAQQPNQGRAILQKLDEESNKCYAAVIVMTGDDAVGQNEVRARENVMHEIGFFQGKLGLSDVILLHEEGVNLPSNIHGLVYIPFPKGYVEATLGAIHRELKVIIGST